MTVNELIEMLQAMPANERELPVIRLDRDGFPADLDHMVIIS